MLQRARTLVLHKEQFCAGSGRVPTSLLNSTFRLISDGKGNAPSQDAGMVPVSWFSACRRQRVRHGREASRITLHFGNTAATLCAVLGRTNESIINMGNELLLPQLAGKGPVKELVSTPSPTMLGIFAQDAGSVLRSSKRESCEVEGEQVPC